MIQPHHLTLTCNPPCGCAIPVTTTHLAPCLFRCSPVITFPRYPTSTLKIPPAAHPDPRSRELKFVRTFHSTFSEMVFMSDFFISTSSQAANAPKLNCTVRSEFQPCKQTPKSTLLETANPILGSQSLQPATPASSTSSSRPSSNTSDNATPATHPPSPPPHHTHNTHQPPLP